MAIDEILQRPVYIVPGLVSDVRYRPRHSLHHLQILAPRRPISAREVRRLDYFLAGWFEQPLVLRREFDDTMIKQTRAYRAALVLLADALARQDAAAVISSIRAGEVILDLDEVLERRHPDFYAEMDVALGEQVQRRKQTGIERRRATLRSKTTTPS